MRTDIEWLAHKTVIEEDLGGTLVNTGSLEALLIEKRFGHVPLKRRRPRFRRLARQSPVPSIHLTKSTQQDSTRQDLLGHY